MYELKKRFPTFTLEQDKLFLFILAEKLPTFCTKDAMILIRRTLETNLYSTQKKNLNFVKKKFNLKIKTGDRTAFSYLNDQVKNGGLNTSSIPCETLEIRLFHLVVCYYQTKLTRSWLFFCILRKNEFDNEYLR